MDKLRPEDIRVGQRIDFGGLRGRVVVVRVGPRRRAVKRRPGLRRFLRRRDGSSR